MNKEIIKKTAEFAQQTLQGEGSGHDWWHVLRVWNNAKMIGSHEQCDLFVVELAALLHDIADQKFHDGDDSVGPRKAQEWLESQEVDEERIYHICDIVENLSYSKSVGGTKVQTIEAQIVQDADRLDAMGAIGIARTFAYSGHKNRTMHDPNIKPQDFTSTEQYRNADSTAINHFYEKLLLLKDLMNTKTAKKIAADRHEYMQQYLEQFYAEWNGEQ